MRTRLRRRATAFGFAASLAWCLLTGAANADIVEFRSFHLLLTVPDNFYLREFGGEYHFLAEGGGAKLILLQRMTEYKRLYDLPPKFIQSDLLVKKEDNVEYGGIAGKRLLLAAKDNAADSERGMVVFFARHGGANIAIIGQWENEHFEKVISAVFQSLAPTTEEPLGVSPEEYQALCEERAKRLRAWRRLQPHLHIILRDAIDKCASPEDLLGLVEMEIEKKSLSVEALKPVIRRGVEGYAKPMLDVAARLKKERELLADDLEDPQQVVDELSERLETLQQELDELKDQPESDNRDMAIELQKEDIADCQAQLRQARQQLAAAQEKMSRNERKKLVDALDAQYKGILSAVIAGRRPPNLPPLEDNMAVSENAPEKSLLQFLEE